MEIMSVNHDINIMIKLIVKNVILLILLTIKIHIYF